MNKGKMIKILTASAMATSTVAALGPISADAASKKVDTTISKAEKQIQKAYKSYYNAKSVASASLVRKELNTAKQLYKEAQKEISKSGGSKKKYYNAKLEKSKKYIERTEGYLEGLEYAESVDKKADSLEDAVKKGDKNTVKRDYPSFDTVVKNAEKKIQALVYGKSVEQKLAKKYVGPSKGIHNALKVYYYYLKAEEAILKGDFTTAKKEMDYVAKELSKVSKTSSFGKIVHAYVEKVVKLFTKSQGPVLKYTGATSIEVKYGSDFKIPAVTATDNVDKVVEVKHVVAGPNGATSINTKIPGEYTITYTATDSDGNAAPALVITVKVKNLEVTFMHTNDTHANVENIPRRVTAIKQIRQENPDSLLLDAGDVFSGTLYFNEYKGQADLELMNLIGYDAMTFGNHEFDLGTEPLAKFVANAKFPFVSANVNFTNDVNLKGRFHDEITTTATNGEIFNGIVKEVNGEKVGIFGLTTAETSTISSPGAGVAFENYIAEAKKAVDQFKAQGINKIVALSHLGYQDGGGDNDVTLAKEVEGIDVIIGGHSHDMLTSPVLDTTGEEPTVILQANEYGKYLGVVDVEFDTNGKVLANSGKLIEINKKENDQYVLQEDQEATQIVATKYKPAIDTIMKTVVGKSSVLLDGERANVRTKETNLGNLITDGMLAKAKSINPKTVIALQNGGGIRASIPEGDMTLGQILTVMPFGNALGILELTGAEIKAALEHSVDMAPEQSGAFLHVSGLKFTYDSSKPVGERVQEVSVKEDGTNFVALDPAKKYFVATNTFTAKGGDNYTMFKKAYEEGRLSEPGFVDWEMFRDYVVANPILVPAVEGRIVDVSAK